MNSIYDTHPRHEQITNRINELFNELVPVQGKCETVAGEMIRALTRIIYRWENDGDVAGIGYGKETVNPAVRYLNTKYKALTGEDLKVMTYYVEDWGKEEDYDYTVYCDAEKVLDFIDRLSGLKRLANNEDMFDYATNDDVDDSGEDWDTGDYEVYQM